MPYGSVGAAFTGGVEDFMARKFTQDLAMRREAREQKIAEDEHNERVAALEEKRQEARERMREKERGEVEKTVANMEPGDIPDQDLQEQARKHHVPIRLIPPKPVQPAAPEGIASMDAPKGPESIPEGTGVLKSQPQVQPYAGSMKQRAELDKETKVKELMQRIPSLQPGTPEYQQAVLEYEMATGKSVPQRTGGTGDTEDLYVFNPRSGVYTSKKTGQEVSSIPRGAKVERLADPESTSGRDAAIETRKTQQLIELHKEGRTELDKWAAPFEAQMKADTDFLRALADKTPTSDSVIADLLYKTLITGPGSGARMNNQLIERIQNGRSIWETLTAKINRWKEGKEALSITEPQRSFMRQIAEGIRANNKKVSSTLDDAREEADTAFLKGDMETLVRSSTKARKALDADAQNDVAPSSPTPNRIYYDARGNVIPAPKD